MEATRSGVGLEALIRLKEIKVPLPSRADCAAISPDGVDDLPGGQSGATGRLDASRYRPFACAAVAGVAWRSADPPASGAPARDRAEGSHPRLDQSVSAQSGARQS